VDHGDSWTKGANATTQMEILSQGQALGQAKADAGLRVSVYLEQVEQRLRANPNMPDATRQELLDRTRRFVQENRDFLAKQSEMIRNRSNFKPGALEQLQPPAAPDISQIGSTPTTASPQLNATQPTRKMIGNRIFELRGGQWGEIF
jgi:hypothetical protein